MRIVAARHADTGALAALMASSPLLRRYRVTRIGARTSLDEALREGDVLLLARVGERVAGLLWLVPSRAFDRSAYLRLLLVAETDRSRGVGSALLERGEAAARRGRARHLGLLVTSTNRGARRFYADRGYRHVSTLPNFVRAGLDEALYLKRLRANPRGRRRRAVGR